ncbi:hypothetical protein R6G85_08225, partial [Actinotignum urinale]|nr:hypothetical protein [Actinotignum urinale]
VLYAIVRPPRIGASRPAARPRSGYIRWASRRIPRASPLREQRRYRDLGPGREATALRYPREESTYTVMGGTRNLPHSYL